MNRIEYLEAELAKARAAEEKRAERFGAEPAMPGSALVWEVTHANGAVVHRVAVKTAGGEWSNPFGNATSTLSWEDVTDNVPVGARVWTCPPPEAAQNLARRPTSTIPDRQRPAAPRGEERNIIREAQDIVTRRWNGGKPMDPVTSEETADDCINLVTRLAEFMPPGWNVTS